MFRMPMDCPTPAKLSALFFLYLFSCFVYADKSVEVITDLDPSFYSLGGFSAPSDIGTIVYSANNETQADFQVYLRDLSQPQSQLITKTKIAQGFVQIKCNRN